MVEKKLDKKAPMILGIGAALVGVFLLLRKKKPANGNGIPPPPPPPPGYASLYGTVRTDDGQPIEGVLVTLDNGQFYDSTPLEGGYVFVNLQPGAYTVVFSKDNYITETRTITLVEGNNQLNVALASAAFIGFTLFVANAPQDLVLWNANFTENTFNYSPPADSGWLAPGDTWEFQQDPLGIVTLRIWALDADNNILFDVYNLGPVNNGKHYLFDYATSSLGEV